MRCDDSFHSFGGAVEDPIRAVVELYRDKGLSPFRIDLRFPDLGDIAGSAFEHDGIADLQRYFEFGHDDLLERTDRALLPENDKNVK
jgi:hypothetical protein